MRRKSLFLAAITCRRILRTLLAVFASIIFIGARCASADEFYASSEHFAYFIVENQGLMEVDLETDEAIIYDEYGGDIASIAMLDDGDILLNTRNEIVATDLYGNERVLFAIADPDSWIYHMKRFGDKLYIATTDHKIYEMELDGSDLRELADNAYLLDFAVCDSKLYYCDGTAMYALNLLAEQSDTQIVIDDIVDAVEVFGGDVYFVRGIDRALYILDPNGEGHTQIISKGVRDFSVLPDGKHVAMIHRVDSSLRVLDTALGEEIVKIPGFCVGVVCDAHGLYIKIMETGEGFGDLSKYTIYRVNSDGSVTVIGDD